MQILITGGTGFIGQALIASLPHHEFTVLTRDTKRARQRLGDRHTYLSSLAQLSHLSDFDAVINLAGEPIADGRWTIQKKRAICDSRWQITAKLTALLDNSQEPPRCWLNASAIGIYGPRDSTPVDESASLQATDFAAQVCERWEQLARRAEERTRLCILRIGLVMHPEGGALKKMLPPFRLGLGGRIGDGQQMMSWIHRDDLVALFGFLLENDDACGVFNATAPNPVSNQVFTETLAKTLGKPALLPAPEFALKLAFGEMSILLLTGQAVVPRAAQDAGFIFHYPKLDEALGQLLA
ncbi:TIGR01777 family oxidoreductase [Ferrimonas gelatinilytica]|uniref:TIGR01777 family oxidoreductase n=1 Tax=Ferrimonas gelatinilytica TaxID=1255257 RepID=A0ABP9RZT5_9GAMM